MSKSKKSAVEKTAELAKLEFEPEALDRFVPTFEQILGYFEQLEAVDTSDVEPTYHALHVDALETPLRPDQCATSLDRDEVLRSAPESREGSFVVPKVIE